MENQKGKWKIIGNFRKYIPINRIIKTLKTYFKEFYIETEIREVEVIDKIDYENFEVLSHTEYEANFLFKEKVTEFFLDGTKSSKIYKTVVFSKRSKELTDDLKKFKLLEEYSEIIKKSNNKILIIKDLCKKNKFQI